MLSLLNARNIPGTFVLCALFMITTHAHASEKPVRSWSVVETAKDTGHRLSAVTAPSKAAAPTPSAIVCDPSK